MHISPDSQSIHRLLPSRKVHTSDGAGVTHVNKTQHITTSLNSDAKVSPNHNNQQTIYNAVSAISMLQIASDSLEEIRGGLRELRNLGLAAEQNISNSVKVAELQTNADDIVAGIQDILESTKFRGEALLTEHSNHTVMTDKEAQNALQVTTYDIDSEFAAAGLYSLDVRSKDSANAINDSIDAVNLIGIAYNTQQNTFNDTVNQTFQQTGSQQQESTTSSTLSPETSIPVTSMPVASIPMEGAEALSVKTVNDMAANALSLVQAQANISSDKGIRLLTK